MASNLDYLDPALVPLEEKIAAYLTAEKALRRATDAGIVAGSGNRDQARSNANYSQGPLHDSPESLRADLAQLEQEVIALLPTRDEWVKVNLGYGPSRVGAWQVPGAADRYKLRVVH